MAGKSPLGTIWQLLPMAILSLAASSALFGVVLYIEQHNAEARFRELAEQRIIAIRANVAMALDSVGLIVGHFSVTPLHSTSREAFRRLVGPALEKQSFVQGYAWNPRIPRTDAPAFEEAGRRDGLEGFRFTERDAQGKPRPVGERAEYVPVYYVEPVAANRAALGFDLASHPVRRQALETARDQGRPQATGRITLVLDYGDDQYGILILAPVFGTAGPGDVESNRKALTGYVSGVFRMGDLIDSAAAGGAAEAARSLVDMHLFDMSAAEADRVLYPKRGAKSIAGLTGGLHVAKTFEVAGRTWQLLASPSAAYLKSTIPLGAYVTLVIALLATVFYLSFLSGRISQAENAKAAAREIGRARQRLSAAQGIARLGTMEFDVARRSFTAGRRATELLGLPADHAGGSAASMVVNVHPDDRARVEGALQEATNRPCAFEFRVGQDEGARTVQALAGEVVDAEYRIIALQDVTARKAAEEEHAGMIRRIAESERFEALGTLAGGIAHEINTPAQYVGDNLEFLASGFEDLQAEVRGVARIVDGMRQRQEFSSVVEQIDALAAEADLDYLFAELPTAIEHSRDGIRQISRIVLAMKEFSHPGSKEKTFADINHALENTVTISRNEWKHVAEVVTDLWPDLQAVPCLPGELNQVFLNLIVNAAQALAEAGRTPETGRIAVSTAVRDGFAVIRVADNGPGIPAAIQDKIFNPFFTTKPVGKGTGQGLAIARDIVVKKHEGEIGFETRMGEGTTFTIRLPLTLGSSVTEDDPSDQPGGGWEG